MAATSYNPAPGNTRAFVPVNAPASKKRASKPSAEELELRLATVERERREIHQELFEAAQVQRRLSGPRQVRRGRYEIASEVFAVRHLAGDFVTALEVGTQTWVALGDITGKGLAAAMWFTHLVSLIRCHASKYRRTAPVMRELNDNLCALQPNPPFTSMVLFALDESGQVECCNAGHPAALVLRRGGEIETLETGGPLLGVVPGTPYQSGNLVLQAGDLLLGCTDGVLESRNASDEDFGHDRLVRIAREHEKESAQAILFSILGAVQDFVADLPRRDDMSLLVIRPATT